ncbi:DnaD domain protein [Salinicoccus sp. CNSTN-B1]
MLADYIQYMNVPVNKILLDNYSKLGLDEKSLIIVIRLSDIRQKSAELPDFKHLSEGMTISFGEVSDVIQHLIENGLLEVETVKDEGRYVEHFSLEPLFRKLPQFIEEKQQSRILRKYARYSNILKHCMAVSSARMNSKGSTAGLKTQQIVLSQ